MTAFGVSPNVFKKYTSAGRVNYSLLSEEPWLSQLIEEIASQDIDEMTDQERLSFWLNAYNVVTIKAVLRKLDKSPNWQGVTSLFQKFLFFVWNKHRIAGRKMSLYHLENKIIRKFGDPRIHFALNCASGSCPYLPSNLFQAATLEEDLDRLASVFINEQGGAVLEGNRLRVSEIFKMYKEDFGGEPTGIVDFVRRYWNGTTLPDKVTLEYMDYDWSLNTQ